ncbi:hypothetical protein [Haloarcula sp. Atlit-7R]|uniref:hypothetical protein n=1 Tax=Haloarcula sp. Atlit-7R TaxID=2282125 RepID=UPI001F354D16|nr:hypothetical protein [Haloarcula sp. Atlit-7R]
MGIGDNSGQGPRAGRPLLARLAGRLGASGDRSTGTPAVWGPLTWFAVAVVAVELVGLQGYRLLTGQVLTFVQNPLWLVRPLVLLGAALATESLYRRYDRALARSNIEARVDDASRFDGLVPDRLVWLLVGLGTGFTLVNAVVILTVPQLYAAGGATRVFRFLVVTLDYLDPEQLGGMRPVGELVKVAYYYLMVGLVAYAVATYGPHILGGALGYSALDAPGLAVNAAFTAVWVLSVGVMAYGIYVLHQHMARQKRELLYDLDRRARDHVDAPWDIRSFDALNPPAEYRRYRKQVEFVTGTKEYPATFTMWTQLVVGVMIPKALQLLLAAV